MSLSSISPVNFARTGPIFCTTFAVNSVGEVLVISSQPGMLAANTSGSFSAAQTSAGMAAIIRSPDISIWLLPVGFTRWKGSKIRGRYNLTCRKVGGGDVMFGAVFEDFTGAAV